MPRIIRLLRSTGIGRVDTNCKVIDQFKRVLDVVLQESVTYIIRRPMNFLSLKYRIANLAASSCMNFMNPCIKESPEADRLISIEAIGPH